MVSEPLGSHQMAESSNSNPSTFTLPNITYLAPTKLDDHNYLAWEFQFQPILKTYGLMGIVDGSEPSPPKFLSSAAGSSADKEQLSLNPEYFIWERKDQFILSWFIANLTEKVVPTIYGMTTAKLVWNALANRYANPSRSRINQLRRQLQMLRQCTKNCAEFVRTAKMLADQLAILGKPVGDDDLISYIVGGLKPQYNSFVTSFSFANKDDSMDLKSFLSQLLSYEQLIEHQNQDATAEASSYALLSQRPNQHPAKPKFAYQPQRRPQHFSKPTYVKKPCRPSGNQAPRNQAPGNNVVPSSNFNTNRVACQICGKNNHQAFDCFHRMDFSFQGRHPPSELAAMVSQSTALHEEDEWLADSGANNHLTADLNNLTLQQVAVGNGSGLFKFKIQAHHLFKPLTLNPLFI
jgi:hypothetical protein